MPHIAKSSLCTMRDCTCLCFSGYMRNEARHVTEQSRLLAHSIFGWLCRVAVVHSDSLTVLPAKGPEPHHSADSRARVLYQSSKPQQEYDQQQHLKIHWPCAQSCHKLPEPNLGQAVMPCCIHKRPMEQRSSVHQQAVQCHLMWCHLSYCYDRAGYCHAPLQHS